MEAVGTTSQNETVSLARSRRKRVSSLLLKDNLPLVVMGLCGLATPELVEAWVDQLEDCLLRVVLHYGTGRQDMELAIGRHETGSLRRITLSAMPMDYREGEWFPLPAKTSVVADTGWIPLHDAERLALLLEQMLRTALLQLVSKDTVRQLAERGHRAMMSPDLNECKPAEPPSGRPEPTT